MLAPVKILSTGNYFAGDLPRRLIIDCSFATEKKGAAVRLAHKKAGSTAKTNRDSNSKRLGVKKYGGELVSAGNIIVRQKGNKFHAGKGVKLGNDFTIFALQEGKVEFKQKLGKKVVNVI